MAKRTDGYERFLRDKISAAESAVEALTVGGLHPEWDSKKIEAILLVGSIGKGLTHKKSDVDLLVLTEGRPALLQKDLKPLLQHIADRSETVPYIDARTINKESFRKSLENRLTGGKVVLWRMSELKRVVSKSGKGRLHEAVDGTYPLMQRFFQKLGEKGIDERNAEAHTAEEQLMSMVMYEKNPGTVERMFSNANLRPDGLFRFQGFDKVMKEYLGEKRGLSETRKMLDANAPYLWKTHLKNRISSYEMHEHRKMLRKLI